jgi:hypothetical protein
MKFQGKLRIYDDPAIAQSQIAPKILPQNSRVLTRFNEFFSSVGGPLAGSKSLINF